MGTATGDYSFLCRALRTGVGFVCIGLIQNEWHSNLASGGGHAFILVLWNKKARVTGNNRHYRVSSPSDRQISSG